MATFIVGADMGNVYGAAAAATSVLGGTPVPVQESASELPPSSNWFES
jgi:hypothetical protein